MSQWQRGRKTGDVYLTPDEFKAASQAFRELQRRVPFVAQLIAEGLTEKEICQRLKWGRQSLRHVLADSKLNLDRKNLNRRIFRKAS